MKIFLALILCLLPLSAHADILFADDDGGAATASYCDGSNSNILCEDSEGSSLCYSGYDSSCRQTYTSLAVGAGDSIDFTTTHGGTFACTDKGTNAVTITVTAASHNTYFYKTADANKSAVYGQFYFLVSSESLANSQTTHMHSVRDNSSNRSFDIGIIQNGSGLLKLTVAYWNGTAITQPAAAGATISTGNWYKVTYHADVTAKTLTVDLDGVNVYSTATYNDTVSPRIPRQFLFGSTTSGSNAAMTYQLDSIKDDDTAAPAACHQ